MRKYVMGRTPVQVASCYSCPFVLASCYLFLASSDASGREGKYSPFTISKSTNNNDSRRVTGTSLQYYNDRNPRVLSKRYLLVQWLIRRDGLLAYSVCAVRYLSGYSGKITQRVQVSSRPLGPRAILRRSESDTMYAADRCNKMHPMYIALAGREGQCGSHTPFGYMLQTRVGVNAYLTGCNGLDLRPAVRCSQCNARQQSRTKRLPCRPQGWGLKMNMKRITRDVLQPSLTIDIPSTRDILSQTGMTLKEGMRAILTSEAPQDGSDGRRESERGRQFIGGRPGGEDGQARALEYFNSSAGTWEAVRSEHDW